MNSDTLSIKQARLAMLNQIVQEYRITKRTVNLHLPTPSLASTSPLSVEFINLTKSLLSMQSTLNDLESKGLINIDSTYGTLEGVTISIVDIITFLEYHKELDELIPATGNLPRIIYSLSRNAGKINGQAFRFYSKSDNRKLFRKLVNAKEFRLSRSDAWKAISRRRSVNEASSIQEFSKVVSKLRVGLKGIDKDHLEYKNNVLTLYADITLTD